MPLRCLDGTADVHAHDFDEERWALLRVDNLARRRLRMLCCDSPVVLKTSKLGTRFFAHARRGACTTAPESEHHLLAKFQIAAAAVGAGWRSVTEARGTGPLGGEWVADVLAEQGEQRIAFEVQWSRQVYEETKRRQARYRAAGIQGVWLVRHPTSIEVDRDVPAFRLRYDEERRQFDVQLPSAHFSGRYAGRRELNSPRTWMQAVPLPVFVRGVLGGALRWAPVLGARVPVEVCGARNCHCWKCKRQTTLIVWLRLKLSAAFPGFEDQDTTLSDWDDFEEAIRHLLPAERLRNHGAGPVARRFSRTADEEYLSNGCLHCGALQGQFFLHEYFGDTEVLFSGEIEVPSTLDEEHSLFGSLNCWWMDEAAISG